MGIDLILKVIGEPLVLAFLIASALRPAFRRYPYAILYIAGMLVSDVVRESVLIRFGLTSREYLLAYFFTDYQVVLLKCLAAVGFLEIALCQSRYELPRRWAFLFRLALIAVMSYAFVSRYLPNLYRRELFLELQRNLYFTSTALTILVWITLERLRLRDLQLRVVVCGIGVSSALQACAGILMSGAPGNGLGGIKYIFRRTGPVATSAMLLVWVYAIMRLPTFPHAGFDENESYPVEKGLAPVMVREGSN